MLIHFHIMESWRSHPIVVFAIYHILELTDNKGIAIIIVIMQLIIISVDHFTIVIDSNSWWDRVPYQKSNF